MQFMGTAAKCGKLLPGSALTLRLRKSLLPEEERLVGAQHYGIGVASANSKRFFTRQQDGCVHAINGLSFDRALVDIGGRNNMRNSHLRQDEMPHFAL
jgi:hypothetical protein